MAPLKAITVWQPRERHATFAGWMMVAGDVGAIGASVLNEGFGKELAARANTALNPMMFGGSFIVQWGIGVVAEAAAAHRALDAAGDLRMAFAIALAGDIAAFAWFARGWRRHAAVHAVPAGA